MSEQQEEKSLLFMGIGSAAEKDLKYKPGPGFTKHPISSTFKLLGEGFFLSNTLTLLDFLARLTYLSKNLTLPMLRLLLSNAQ